MKFDQFQHAGITDVGVKRSHNQDAYATQLAPTGEHFATTGHIFLVADGMGGHAVGEKASAKAIREIPHTYLKHAAEGPAAAIRRAFLETNAGIHAIGQENPEFRGLGTTASALVLRAEGAWVGHVGDSRVYRIRDGIIEQLSYDHSLVWELARQQGVDPEELSDVRKNVIIRSLGPDALVQVDVEGPYPLRPGDVFVLCSDGLSNPLQSDEIGAVVSVLPPPEACKFLVELANLRGGPDNITAIVVRVNPRDGESSSGIIPPVPNRPSLVRRFFAAWFQLMPWPLTVLFIGFLLASAFIMVEVNELPGGTLLFVLAAITIGVGLIGLGIHSRNEADDPEDDEPPVRANIYRKYPCQVEAALLTRFRRINDQLTQHLQNKHWPYNDDQHKQLLSQAEQLQRAGDAGGAFREICRAIQLLAHCFNQHRNKEESFQPKWDVK